jgi:hypothetical protein
MFDLSILADLSSMDWVMLGAIALAVIIALASTWANLGAGDEHETTEQ